VLDRAGARDADLMIAATHSDEVNMVTCQVAHSVFQVPRKIARLRSSAYLDAIYSDLYRTDHLPIDVVISPEREVAEAALQRLSAPSTFDAESFLDGRLHLLGIALEEDSPVLNTPLRQLNDMFSSLSRIVAGVRRGGKLFAPRPAISFSRAIRSMSSRWPRMCRARLRSLASPPRSRKTWSSSAAGNVGLAVAQALEARPDRVRVKLIERNRARAEDAADALTRTIVLNGDGLSAELLEEAGVPKADAVLAITDDDKTNILAAVRAKQAGAKLAIALVNDPTLMSLMEPLDIDAYINPRATTVSTILRHIRHGRVRDIYSIGDAEAEVIEAQVLSTSPIAGRPVRDIEFPEGALIGGVQKGGRVVKPTGDMRIEEGDIVVIFRPGQGCARGRAPAAGLDRLLLCP
jgi:trk system potassium uptake protein TrkA